MICDSYDLQIAGPHPGDLYAGNVPRESVLYHKQLSGTNAQRVNKPLPDPCRGPGGRRCLLGTPPGIVSMFLDFRTPPNRQHR